MILLIVAIVFISFGVILNFYGHFAEDNIDCINCKEYPFLSYIPPSLIKTFDNLTSLPIQIYQQINFPKFFKAEEINMMLFLFLLIFLCLLGIYLLIKLLLFLKKSLTV